jgi:mRNA-degrading endonuclease RelE of RelBE toxin-antitoxin system
MYKRVITPSAKRSIKKLPRQVREELLKETKGLEDNSFAGEKLSGQLHFLHSLHFKLQNVEYRVAYTVNPDRK